MPHATIPSLGTVAERVRLARRWSSLTRKALAARVGVSPSAAAQWEQPSGTMPNVENLARIALVARVSFEWLATGRGEPRTSNLDPPAAVLATFAHDLEEEHLLRLWRRLPAGVRERMTALIETIAR
jgi:transcriptional regulator with XRE-family HTH domain